MAITGDWTGAGTLSARAAFGTRFGSEAALGSGAGLVSGGRMAVWGWVRIGESVREFVRESARESFGDSTGDSTGGCGFRREGLGVGIAVITGAGLALAAGNSIAFL